MLYVQGVAHNGSSSQATWGSGPGSNTKPLFHTLVEACYVDGPPSPMLNTTQLIRKIKDREQSTQ